MPDSERFWAWVSEAIAGRDWEVRPTWALEEGVEVVDRRWWVWLGWVDRGAEGHVPN